MFVLVSMVGGQVGDRQPGWSLLGWVTLAVAVAYVVECAVWPMARCRLCGGTGKLQSPITRSWRECRCDKGQTVRWGRRLLGGVYRTGDRDR